MSMTENEFRELKRRVKENKILTFTEVKYIVQAIEEIQQYRAIGTVEEVKYLIDSYNGMIHDFGDNMVALEAYKEIGTIEECRTAVERMKPKKAKVSRKHHEAYCPNCNYVISDDEFYLLDDYTHYCKDCGQAVKGTDWSE